VLKPILIGFLIGFALVGAARLSETRGDARLVQAASRGGAALGHVATAPCAARPGAYVRVLA
jgi:hypothetical protein